MATVEAMATTRLQTVEVGERSLASYLNVALIHILEALDREAEKLRGARILQLNATPYGGGVSELLGRCAPARRPRARRRMAGDHRRRAVLPRHQGDPQRLAGRSRTLTGRATPTSPPGAERRAGRGRLRLRGRPRSSAGGVAAAARQGQREVGVALPHRDERAEPGYVGVPRLPVRLRRGGVHAA